jgi:hypothetical protein
VLLITNVLYSGSLILPRIIPCYDFLVVHVGLISILTINKNYPFISRNASSSAIALFIRVISASTLILDVFIVLVMSFFMRLFFPSLNQPLNQPTLPLHQHLILACALCNWTIAILIWNVTICRYMWLLIHCL